MRLLLVLTICALSLLAISDAKKGFGPGEQEWGYVTVRPKAHMFWWLYFTTAKVKSFYDKPLVIWLQGGPGASSTSYGNFEELGPLDSDLKERNYTWVKDYNVLFIDNPVGTGFSYVDSLSALTKTNAQIAADLVECIRGFLKKVPGFANVPTYIMSESYGGKMAADFALLWYKNQTAGKIKSNLKGVGLGDAWISPIDSVLTWAQFLLQTGVVDTAGYKQIDEAAQRTKSAVQKGKWRDATNLWGEAESVISYVSDNVDFYNILTRIPSVYMKSYALNNPSLIKKANTLSKLMQYNDGVASISVDGLMNGAVRTALGLNKTHGAQSYSVFDYLSEDFMKPVVTSVQQLLDNTNLRVFVYTGQLDLIVDTPGTVVWVEAMKWKFAKSWAQSPRRSITVDRINEGYVKSYGNFGMYWVNRAGHMVPADNPKAMAKILKDMTNKA